MKVSVTIPGHVPSAGNMREHWRARAKRAKSQRADGQWAAMTFPSLPVRPVTVTLTRISPRPLDSDNMAFSVKAHRDGVADAFGVADNDPRFTWLYAQERGTPALRIEIEEKTNAR